MKLLIEIGTEELPAIPFLKECNNITFKWDEILEKQGLKSKFEFFYTPRRLVFLHENFATKQENSLIKHIGAPKHIAIKDGIFTNAALAFAKKCGISQQKLEFKNIDGKEVLYFEELKEGKNTNEILPQMIDELLKSLNFGRSMRWGMGKFEFIRPITSLVCVLGDKLVRGEIFGINCEMAFFPHRKFGYEKIEFKSIDEYFVKLRNFGVILDQVERKKMILSQFEALEKTHNISIEKDSELLSEVVAISENPNALLGEFDKEFLKLPSEVIITSMKINQRYFPVFKNGALKNAFVFVSNAITDDNSLIIKGNEKVLKARLSDAMFFWENDLKTGLNPKSLENILYLKELGSVAQKQEREAKISINLAKIYTNELKNLKLFECENLLSRAIMLSKCDLTTQMVGEFAELQGIMGFYYAQKSGENEFVCLAIKEQYLPNGENSALPSNIFSAIVAIACKLDTLMGLFEIGKIPTGNKDPYALRRQASGIIKIALSQNISFDLREILTPLSEIYPKLDKKTLIDFILERLYGLYDINASIIKACINSGECDILRLHSAINALDKLSKETDFKEKFSTFKRLANIIKDEKIGVVDETKFIHNSETELNNAFKKINLDENSCEIYLNSLFLLKNEIDEFFENVMINIDDKAIKANRIALIGQIYKAFLKVADIKEISF